MKTIESNALVYKNCNDAEDELLLKEKEIMIKCYWKKKWNKYFEQ